MNLGLFGTIILDTVELTSLDSDYNTEYAEHARFGAKPLLQGVGDSLIEKRLHLECHADNGNPQKRLDALQTMRSSMQAGELIMGGRHHGWYVITSLSVTDKSLTADGVPLWLSINLTIKEYVGDTKPNPSTPAVAKNSVNGEPINSQSISPAEQMGKTSNAPQATLASVVAVMMQAESASVLIEQQAMMAEQVSPEAGQLLAADMLTNLNALVNMTQSGLTTLSTFRDLSGTGKMQSLLATTLGQLQANQMGLGQAISNTTNFSANFTLSNGQLQTTLADSRQTFGSVNRDLASITASLILR